MKKSLYALIFLSFLYSETDINSATAEELMEVKGIGKKLAEKIIEYRTNHKIENINDLKNISGLGDKKISALKREFQIYSAKNENSDNNDSFSIQQIEQNSTLLK
jgi:competence ComEA-like helix-hairpin-helix protein